MCVCGCVEKNDVNGGAVPLLPPCKVVYCMVITNDVYVPIRDQRLVFCFCHNSEKYVLHTNHFPPLKKCLGSLWLHCMCSSSSWKCCHYYPGILKICCSYTENSSHSALLEYIQHRAVISHMTALAHLTFPLGLNSSPSTSRQAIQLWNVSPEWQEKLVSHQMTQSHSSWSWFHLSVCAFVCVFWKCEMTLITFPSFSLP